MTPVASLHRPLARVETRPDRPPERRGPVVAWALYDFANSAFAAVVMATVYSAYYAIGVVGNDRGEGDLWWGRVVSLSRAIVAVMSPFLGAVADRSGVRRTLFITFTLLSVAATALLATVEPGMVLWGFLLGVLGNVCQRSPKESHSGSPIGSQCGDVTGRRS